MQITGLRLSLFARIVSNVVIGLIISFAATWEFAFFVVIIFPVQLLVGFFEVQLLKGQMKKNKEDLEASGKLTVESIDNIRTVVGLGAEERFFDKYTNILANPFK